MSDRDTQPRPNPSLSGGDVVLEDSPIQSAWDEILDDKKTIEDDLEAFVGVMRSAGVHESKINELRTNPSIVAMVAAHPELAVVFGQRFPATHVNGYYQMEQALGFDTRLPTSAPLGDAASFLTTGTTTTPEPTGLARAGDFLTSGTLPPPEEDTETSDTGGVRHKNGVLVDMVNGVVAFPNDPNVAGSAPWLAAASKWGAKKVQHWRKVLAKNGYLESAKGGKDVPLFEALRQFHQNLYLYGSGKEAFLI